MARSLAGRTRFSPEAGAGGDIFLWQFFFSKNLVVVKRRQRDLRRPDQARRV